jgi:hypothetical protein
VITSPIGPLPATSARRSPNAAADPEAPSRLWITAGLVLIALGILGGAVWAIFLSPFGFSRFSLESQYRSFDAHRPGTYVVYLEGPGASRPSLPPALDVTAAGTGGQRVDVTRVGSPGVVGAADTYDVAGYEGRAVAIIHLRQSGSFLLTVSARPPGQFDTTQYAEVDEDTVAVGRGLGLGWPTTQWCGLVMVGVPAALGAVAIVVGRRRRRRLTGAGSTAALR